MSGSRKWLVIALLALLLLGLAALAAGLPGMRLHDGRPFRLPANSAQAADALGGDSIVERGFVLGRGLIAALLIIYPIYILNNLLSKKGRRKLVNDLIRLAVIVVLLYVFNLRGAEIFKNLNFAANLGALAESLQDPNAPLAVFNPTTPRWIPVGLLLIGAILLAAMVGAIAWWWFMPTHRGVVQVSPARHKLSTEAQKAISDLQAGDELEDVILRAYYQMERILAEQRGLGRPETMTPSEFAEALGQQGLPKGAVNELTHLFEAVRYGGKRLGPDLQQRATNALRAIILVMPEKKIGAG